MLEVVDGFHWLEPLPLPEEESGGRAYKVLGGNVCIANLQQGSNSQQKSPKETTETHTCCVDHSIPKAEWTEAQLG